MKPVYAWICRLAVGALLFAPALGIASSQCTALTDVGGSCSETGLIGNVNQVIDTLFIVAGAIAVIILIIGGIRYITSTGDATRITAAKNTILYAIIGIIVVLLARAIVGYVLGQIG